MKCKIYPNLGGIALAALLMAGCAEPEQKQQEETTPEVSVEEANDNAVTSKLLKIDSQIFSLPSPIQTAMILRKNEIVYDETLLNSTENNERYINQFQQALNMGVYGADLAYLSNFNNSQLKLDYFKTVEEMAEKLDLRRSIDQSIIDRFAANIENRDSLYMLNAELFKAADQYLKENSDNEMAALILAGGWVEAMHLTIDAAFQVPELRSRIGEQGMAVSSLIRLLEGNGSPQAEDMKNMLLALADEFNGMTASYEYVKPITDATEKVTYLNSKSTVEVSDEQLKAVQEKINDIRQFITQ